MPTTFVDAESTWQLLRAAMPGNIQLNDNRWEVSLSSEWPWLVTSLCEIGQVTTMTRNRFAIVGTQGEYPELTFSADMSRAGSSGGALDVDFHSWSSALFVAEEHRLGFVHFIEIRDMAGEVIHRVRLPGESRVVDLAEWLHLYQADRDDCTLSFSIPPDRWRTVQHRHCPGLGEVEAVSATAMLSILNRARRCRQPACLVVGNEGVVQSVEFIPRTIAHLDGWVFVGDTAAAVHFDNTHAGEVIVHRIPVASGDSLAVLKCFDADGVLFLAAAPPRAANLVQWEEFVSEALGES